MGETIRQKKLKDLNISREMIKKKLNKIDNEISEIEKQITLEEQEKCMHNFKYKGHGHNDDYYVCSKCHLWKYE